MRKRKMRKVTIIMLAMCFLVSCILSAPLTGLASGTSGSQEDTGGSTVITAVVPSTHTLIVKAENVSVSYDGETGASFEVPRLETFTLTVKAEDGYVISGIYLDGTDVSASLVGDTLTLSGIYEVSELAINTAAVAEGEEISGVLYDLPEQDFPDSSLVYKVAVETGGLKEVPSALAGIESLNTVAKITEVLTSVLVKHSGYPEENTSVYEVTLVVSLDGGVTWVEATEENFPANGLTVILPYPDGTAKDTHDFAATHMFTSTAFGKTPGDTENPVVTKTDDGLQMTVTGLSPIAIAWSEINIEPEATETTETESTEEAQATEETEETESTETVGVTEATAVTVTTETEETEETEPTEEAEETEEPESAEEESEVSEIPSESETAEDTEIPAGSSDTSRPAAVIEAVKGAITGDAGQLLFWLLLLAAACGMVLVTVHRSNMRHSTSDRAS